MDPVDELERVFFVGCVPCVLLAVALVRSFFLSPSSFPPFFFLSFLFLRVCLDSFGLRSDPGREAPLQRLPGSSKPTLTFSSALSSRKTAPPVFPYSVPPAFCMFLPAFLFLFSRPYAALRLPAGAYVYPGSPIPGAPSSVPFT